MHALVADCRHALKLYAKTPSSSLVAVGVLAIGLAFVSSFLSLYVDLVLRPVPGFEDSSELVTVGWGTGTSMRGLYPGIVLRAHDETASLDALVAVTSIGLPTFYGPERAQIRVERVTRGFFDGLRPKLSLGRGFTAQEHRMDAPFVTVVSYEFWRTELGADPGVLGTTIELTTQARSQEATEQTNDFEVIGVMAPEMTGVWLDDVDLWLPMERAFPLYYGESSRVEDSTTFADAVIGRTAPGASARAVANELQSRFGDDLTEMRLPGTWRLDAIGGIVDSIPVKRESVRQLNVFLGGSILLALVAACNVSLFLLARAPGRQRELAIRMSVGAPRERLARQLWHEVGVLVAAAAVLGLVLSVWLTTYLQGLAFLRRAEWRHVTLLDWRVLCLVGAFLVLVTLTVAIAPVVGLERRGILRGSRQAAARASPAQRAAGTAQLAISGAVAGAAIAFAWYFGAMVFGFPGYEIENRHVAIFTTGFRPTEVDYARLRQAILSLPATSAVTINTAVPGTSVAGVNVPAGMLRTIPSRLDAAEPFELRAVAIDEHYVDVLGLRLLAGRDLEPGESDAALVNRTFARGYFGRDDVVGESLPLDERGTLRARIVGVLADLSYEHPASPAQPMLFTTSQSIVSSPWPIALIETESTAAELHDELQALVDAGRIEVTLGDVRPLIELRRDFIAPDRARAFLTIATCAIVVALAGFGFYGIQRYLVAAGRREYAIRVALGAGPKAIGRLVIARAIAMSALGLVLGSLLAFIAAAWLRGDFVSRDVSPGVVTLLVLAGLVVLLVGATFAPARQARQTQPASVLREE